MSRRDQKRQAYSGLFSAVKPAESQEKRGDDQRVCGTCRHYSESAYSSDGRGSCSLLKMGSDITVDPPVFVTEGRGGYPTKTLTSAVHCEHYTKMKMIDKDGYECSDPAFRRSIRQLQ